MDYRASRNLKLIIITTLFALLIACLTLGCSSDQGGEKAVSAGAPGMVEGSDATEVDMSEWSVDKDCSVCHSAEHASISNINYTASAHADMGCLACHKDTDGLATVHEAAKSSNPGTIKKLKNPITNEVCLSCHGSYAALAEQTKNSIVLTDEDGTVVNPHAIPVNKKHDPNPKCTDCHKIHTGSDPQAYCYTCHHTKTFECYTCHE
ncbi:cytochrome c3 family protein [Desulfitobacterium hafniense]|nr:cytochrome c3 family protein [Desulfitobacterium hafniense]